MVEPATNCIAEFITMVQGLIEKGYAYVAGGNVYFDTSKLDKYYVFGEHDEEDLAVGVREGVEADDNKTSTAAASTTPSPTTPMRSPSPRAIWATSGATTGSMCGTSTTPPARCPSPRANS